MNLADFLRQGPLAQQRMADASAFDRDSELANMMRQHGTVSQQPSALDRSGDIASNLFYGDTVPPKDKSILDPQYIPMKGAPQKYDGVGMDLVMPAITAWHGSPHKFTKFDMSKIGTGEGAQAYGYGIYAAENPKVAKEYAKMSPMVNASPNRTFLGRELSPGTPEYHAGTLLEQSGMTIPKAKREVQGWIDEHIAKGRPQEDQTFQGWGKTLETLNQAKKKSDFGLGGKENLYKVDIPDDQIAKMLDWDKPLSEQSSVMPKLQSQSNNDAVLAGILKDIDKEGRGVGGAKYRGEDLLRDYESYGELSQPEISNILQQQGIPGIKYLDGGSRSGGQGTSNFVLFSDDIAKILERNDQPIGELAEMLSSGKKVKP